MDPNFKAFLWSLLGIFVGGGLGFLFSRLGRSRDKRSEAEQQEIDLAKAEVKTQKEEVTELKKQMAVLKAEAMPIQAAFQAMLVAGLRHSHTPDTDILLDKSLSLAGITENELAQLDVAMQKRKVEVDDQIDNEERLMAGMLIDSIKLTQIEFERQTKSKTETVLVTQPATEGDPKEETEH